MSWPLDPLDAVSEIYLGPTYGWVDISEDARVGSSGGAITIGRGRGDWGQDTDPGEGSMLLNNRHGKYSDRNPRSVYFGILGRNQPTRIGVRLLRDEFGRTEVNGWGESPAGTWHLPPVEYTPVFGGLDQYAVAAGRGLQTHIDDGFALRVTQAIDLQDLEQVTDFTVPAVVTGAAVVAGHVYRINGLGHYYWCRLEFNTGAAVTTLYDWDVDAEGWAGEGDTSVVRVTTPTHDGAGALEATRTMGAGFSELRFNDGEGLRDLSADGPTLSAWVLVPEDAAGTGWQGRIELQDPGFTWQTGPDFELTPGTWAQLTYTPPADLMSSCRALGFTISATGVDGEQSVYVDTFAQSQRGTTTLKISKDVGDGDVTIAELIDLPGVTYAAGQPLRLRSCTVGAVIGLKAWDPSTDVEPFAWQLVTTDTDLRSPGFPALQTWVVSGNTNDKPFAVAASSHELIDRRAHMEIPAWPQEWDLSEQDRYAPIELAGILRRLGSGKRPAPSAMASYIPGTDPVGAWLFEDGTDARLAKPAIRGMQPMSVRHQLVDFVPEEHPPGLAGSAHPVPTSVDQLMVQGLVGASADSWQVSVWGKGTVADKELGVAYYIAWEIQTTTGQVVRGFYQYDDDAAIGVAVWPNLSEIGESHFVALNDDPDTNGAGVRLNPGITGNWVHLQFYIEQDGADCNAFLYVNGVNVDAQVWSGLTVGAPRLVRSISPFGPDGPSANVSEVWISGLAIHNGGFLVEQYRAGLGFPGETAGNRMVRLAAERGVSLLIVGDPDETAPMGPQPAGTFMDLMWDAVRADGGILVEDRTQLGLVYRTRRSLYNQTPLELSYSQGHVSAPFKPIPDDQLTKNHVIAKREGGGSYEAIQETGPLNIQEPGTDPDGVGAYELPADVNVAYDSQLKGVAGWLKGLGTWDEARFKEVVTDFTATGYLQDAALALRAAALAEGDTFQVNDLPEWLPPEPVLVMVQGYNEVLDAYGWAITRIATPGRPWSVGTLPVRLDTAGCRWVNDLSAGTDTSGLVLSTGSQGGRWIDTDTYPDQFPFEIKTGGTVLEVTGIDPAAQDLYSRVTANGWGTATTGQAWAINSGAAANWSTTGTVGQISTVTINQLELATIDLGTPHANPRAEFVLPVAPTGSGISMWVFARFTDTSNYYYATLLVTSGQAAELRLFKRVAGTGIQLGSTVTLTGAHTAGSRYVLQCSAIDQTIRARAWRSTQPSERGWHITATDTAHTTGNRVGPGVRRETNNTNGTVTIDVDNFWVPSLQAVTFEQAPVNGIERTVSAQTGLSLRDPWRLAR